MLVLKALEKISDVVSKYMALFAILTAIVAFVAPSSLTWAAPHVPALLGVAMFGMGMTLRVEDFREIFRRPRDVLIGVAAQFVIMPLLAYSLATIFNLPADLAADLAAGVILVGTCPGGTSSNVMTFLAKGDLALSVSMTMTTTLFAPFVTPILTL